MSTTRRKQAKLLSQQIREAASAAEYYTCPAESLLEALIFPILEEVHQKTKNKCEHEARRQCQSCDPPSGVSFCHDRIADRIKELP